MEQDNLNNFYSTVYLEFLSQYIKISQNGKYQKNFIKELETRWTGLWGFVPVAMSGKFLKKKVYLNCLVLIKCCVLGKSLWHHLKAAHTQYSTWHKKILPDKDSEDSGRITGFKYHIRRESLGKAQDLLKDEHMNLERTLTASKVKLLL